MDSSHQNHTGKPVRAKLGRDPLGWPQPDVPSWIQTLPMPHAMKDRQSMLGLVILFACIVIGVGTLIILPIAIRGWGNITTFEIVLSGFLLLILLSLVVSYLSEIRRERRFMRSRLRKTTWAPWLRALHEARIPFTRCSARKADKACARLLDALDAEGLELPRTFADLRLAIELDRIPLIDEFLEPEKVIPGSRVDRRRGRNSLIIGAVLLTGGLLLDADVCIVIGIFMIVLPLLSLQVIRRMTPDIRFGFRTSIAGQGFLHVNDSLCFTSTNGTCLVRGIGPARNTDAAVEAWFLCPGGMRMLTFPSVHDPHFVALWQRWNHSDPRPELAGAI